MDNTQLTLGAPVDSDILGASTPSTITTPDGTVYTWDETQGYYVSHETQTWLYLEDEVIRPDSYYEITAL